jgi:hypothetical protein
MADAGRVARLERAGSGVSAEEIAGGVVARTMSDGPERRGPVATFRRNYPGFARRYRWLLAVLLVALLCDASSTIYFMQRDGAQAEVHPVVQLASTTLGTIAGPLVGALAKAAAGVVVAIYWRRFAPYILLAVSMLSFWATWYNIWGADMYIPWILRWIPW